MIKNECFQKEWIDGKRTDLRVADPGLLEKCIYALQLLGRLQAAGEFDFVFKGGTSMVILLSVPKRLSIDIDIASTAAAAEYEPILEEMVKETHAAIFAAENGYRNHRFSVRQALNDTIDTAALISGINLKGGRNDGPARLIQDGIRRIGSHLIGEPYRIDEARVSSSKAACLAAVLMQNRIDQEPDDLRFNPDNMDVLREATIVRWPVLNRLKAISPEAFHYWHLADGFTR